MTAEQIGFIGLGNMGGPMCANLLSSGFKTTVTDLDPKKVSAAVARGASPAASAAEVAKQSSIVLTSLPGPTQVGQIADEILAVMAPKSIWIDLSTNDLACARTIAKVAESVDVHLLDAPVTGGAEGAAAGTLTVLVGGEQEALERCWPVLDAIGERIEHLGPHGSGYVAKITQVSLCYLHSVCLTEALLLGAKGGVDPAKMLEIIQHSTGRSYVADRYGPEILNGGYDDTFDLGLAYKDLRLAMEMARTVDAGLPFMSSVTEFYGEAVEQFGSDAPHLKAMQSLERDNDLILHQASESSNQMEREQS